MWQVTWKGEWEGRLVEAEIFIHDKFRFRLFFDCKKLDEETRAFRCNEVVLRKRFSPKRGRTAAARAVFRSELLCTESPQVVKREIVELFRCMCKDMKKELDLSILDPSTNQVCGKSELDEVVHEQVAAFDLRWIRSDQQRADAEFIYNEAWPKIEKRAQDLEEITSGRHSWFCSVTIDGSEVPMK